MESDSLIKITSAYISPERRHAHLKIAIAQTIRVRVNCALNLCHCEPCQRTEEFSKGKVALSLSCEEAGYIRF